MWDVILAFSLSGVIVLTLSWLRRRAESLGQPMFSVEPDDETMNRAIRMARDRVRDFVNRLRNPSEGDGNFCVKVPVEDGEDVEHMWLEGVRLDGDEFIGVVANRPRAVRNVREGQEWRVARAEISDWMYTNDEKIFGNFTLKAMLSTLPAGERSKLEGMFGDVE